MRIGVVVATAREHSVTDEELGAGPSEAPRAIVLCTPSVRP